MTLQSSPLDYVPERRVELREFLKDRIAHGEPYRRGELMRRLAEVARQIAATETVRLLP